MNAPLLTINHQSTLPPYEQISLQIRMLIAARTLLPGAPLPPVRQLAEDLGVAPNTVMRAYDELEHDGWLVRAARKSVVVASQPQAVHAIQRDRLELAVADLLEVVRLLNISPEEVHSEIDRQFGMLKSAHSIS